MFGNLERGEGFASTASHDQLATICIFQPRNYHFDRIFLVRTWIEFTLERRFFLWLKLGPVNLTVFKIAKFDGADWRLLVEQRGFRVLGPAIGCYYDDAMREWLLARSSEEAINITLLNVVAFVVELALDRMELSRAERSGYEVDSRVFLANTESFWHLTQ